MGIIIINQGPIGHFIYVQSFAITNNTDTFYLPCTHSILPVLYLAHKFIEIKLLYQSVYAFLVLVNCSSQRFYQWTSTPVSCMHTMINIMCYQIYHCPSARLKKDISGWIFISLLMSEVERIFMCLRVIWISVLWTVYMQLLSNFPLGSFLLIHRSSLYIKDINLMQWNELKLKNTVCGLCFDLVYGILSPCIFKNFYGVGFISIFFYGFLTQRL